MDETGPPAGAPFPDAVGGPAFATLSTRSLSPWPDIQHRVKAELMERIQYAAPGPEDDTLLQATARVQAGAAAPPRWRFGWTGLWLIFLALFCWGAWDSYVDHHLTPYPSQGRRNVLTPVLIRRMADLRPGGPIVAVEDNDIGRIAELEAKSMAAPDDPVLYQAWVLFHYANIGKLPDDFDGHWRRIDPGNAFWPALKASVLGKHLMYERRSHRSVSPTEEDLAAVTAAMEEAARQPAWIDRQRSFLALQRAAFRPPYTLEEDQVTAFSAQAARLPGLPSADDCVQYQFDLLIARGDLTAAASLIDTWCRVAEMQLAQPGNPLPWYPPQATGISAGFSREVRKAGLTEQADRIDRLVKAAHSWYRYSATPPPGIRHLPEYYTDLYGGGSFDYDAFPERRMAEYASADRLAALWTAGFLLLVLLGILIFGSGRQKPALARALGPLFPLASTQRIVLLGMVLPAAFWWVAVHLTPAGCRDLGIGYLTLMYKGVSWSLWLFQTLAGILLVLMTLHCVVRGEICRRAAFLSLGPAPRRVLMLDWILTGIVAAWVVIPAVFDYRPEWFPLVTPIAASLLALPLLRLLWCLFSALGKQRESMVANVLINRRFLAPLALLCALLLASIPWLKHRERTCLASDPLTTAGPEATRYENLEIDRRVDLVRKSLSPPP